MLRALGRHEAAEDVGVDATRADGVDPQALAAVLDGHGLGDADQRVLRGAVGDAVRLADHAGGRREVDDVALALEQLRQGGLAQVEGARGVDVEEGLEALGRLVLGERRATDAGDVGQHVEPAEGGDDLGHERGAGGGVGDVELAAAGRATAVGDHLLGLGDAVGVDVGAPHLAALGGDPQRGGPADARGGAGHQRHLADVAARPPTGRRTGRWRCWLRRCSRWCSWVAGPGRGGGVRSCARERN